MPYNFFHKTWVLAQFAAISWMCANQLGRRNITNEQKTYLLGKLYEARKKTQGTNNQYVQAKSEKDQNDLFQNVKSTAGAIAKEQGVGEVTVKRAEHFAKGLDAAEEVSEGFREKVLYEARKNTQGGDRKSEDYKKSRDQNGLLKN